MLNFLKRTVVAIQKAQEKRAAYWQLQNLTDTELRDIGIGRSQIREVIERDVG
jgi:uncharacterized protein YjiS (DUF1127 family)